MKGPAIHTEAVRCLLYDAAACRKLLVHEVPDPLSQSAVGARKHRIQVPPDMPRHDGVGAG